MLDWLGKVFKPGPNTASQEKTATAPSSVTAAAFSAHDAGDWARAVTLLAPLAQARPDDAQVHYRLGDALYQLERAQEALAPLERAVQLAGNVATHHYKLGNALMDLERLDESLACYRRALALEPRHAQSLANTGAVLEMQGKTEEALDHYRRAIAANGALRPARLNLATLLHRTERFAEAVAAYQGLLELEPQSVANWCNLGNLHQELENFDEAVRCYERAMALDPSFAEAASSGAHTRGPGEELRMAELFDRIGTAYRLKRSFETARRFFERAITIAPRYVPARLNLAAIQHNLGMSAESIRGFRDILEIDPQHVHAARHLLMELLYTSSSAESLFEEHLAFGRRFGSGGRAAPLFDGRTRSGRKLRIGYVSSDFRMHAVGYNLQPIIEFHDRNAFEIFLYSIVRKPDPMSRWFKEQASWRVIGPLPDEAAARQIRQDEVDILILLAGRFDENRPLLAIHRAAPIQVSMHDPATSGLAEMDYLIADRALVPRHSPEKFTERVVCLPTFYLHPPLDEAPHDPTPPAARNGWITFGSLNNPAKLNENVVALWAKVLSSVPGSRLLLKYMDIYTVPSVRTRYVSLFGQYGIGEERLIIPREGAENRADHFSRYLQVDIALDPFPFTGSTTTFEALWMGVPVVTLEGSRMVARWSTAMLRKAGLPQLIAGNESEYVEIARALAANPGELARLRAGLRSRIARSPLCAEQARTRQLERLYRRMWKIWVSRQERHA